MQYSIERLQSDVLARLGEISQPVPTLSQIGVISPADVIERMVLSLLPEVGTRLINSASLDKLCDGCEIEVSLNRTKMPSGLYSADLSLPRGFLRLVSIEMSGWSRSVNKVIVPGSAEWNCQWSEESGISGSPGRPRVYLHGGQLRCIGSETADSTLGKLKCWCVPEIDETGNFYFPEGLYGELIREILVVLTKD